MFTARSTLLHSALLTKKQKSALYDVKCTLHQPHSTSRTGPKMYFVKFFFMDTKNLSATYWSMPISRWCLSVLLRHLIHSAEECFDVHHRVQSHCNVAVWWLQYGVVWDKRSPNGPRQPTRWEVPHSSAQPRPVNCSQCSSFAKIQYFDVASFCHSEWEIGCKIFLL